MRQWVFVLVLSLHTLWSPPLIAQQSPSTTEPPSAASKEPPPRLFFVFSGAALYFGSLAVTEALLIRRDANVLANDPRVISRSVAATVADVCLIGAGVTYAMHLKKQKATVSVSTRQGLFTSLSLSF